MADGVRRQFVHGQNHVLNLAFRKPEGTDATSQLGPHRLQHARIEPQIKDRWCAVGARRSRPSPSEPAVTSGRSVRRGDISHKQPNPREQARRMRQGNSWHVFSSLTGALGIIASSVRMSYLPAATRANQ